MDNEANWTSNNSPPKDWPSSGSVTFSDYGKVFLFEKIAPNTLPRNEFYVNFLEGIGSNEYSAPRAIEKSKSWGPFTSYTALPILPIYQEIGQNGQNWQCNAI